MNKFNFSLLLLLYVSVKFIIMVYSLLIKHVKYRIECKTAILLENAK